MLATISYHVSTHMPEDKITVQDRSTGGVDGRTGQATKGFNRGGGLRVGEMEQDAFILWGLSVLIHEFYLSVSDGTVVPFCRDCGMPASDLPAQEGRRMRRRKCFACAAAAAREGRPYLSNVAVTYIGRSTLLVMLTLRAMGIMLRAQFDKPE